MNNKQSSGHNRLSRGIFAALPAEDWRSSDGLPAPITVERKSTLFTEGESASHVYLVLSGLIKTFKNPSHDRVQIINIVSDGDVMGAEALSRDFYQESATTLTRAQVYRLSKEFFLDFINRKPQLALKLIEMMNHEFARVQSLIVNLGTKKALPRVASCLLLFMEKQNAGPPGPPVTVASLDPFTLPISRQDMGAFLGLSPETVSRQLKGLVRAKVIRLDHKRLTVLNLDQLKSIAEAH